jgi:two-component system NtrC family response regulator
LSQKKKVLLIIEDDIGLQKQLKWSFESYEVVIAGDREEAISAVRRYRPDVMTLDLGLPPDPTNASEGLKTLAEILSLHSRAKIIVVTGNDDRENAILAVAGGAYDFYQKPVDIDILSLIIERAFQLAQLEQDKLKLEKNDNEPLQGLIAVSPKMLSLSKMIEKVAPSDITTTLLGESGTGKEVLAKAIHNLSDRKKKRFIAVNCAAIPENLLESELFGYEKGAFTGAVKQTLGKIEVADGGTFFLDEIGDLPMSLQSKLLRFLQERKIERLGGRKEIAVDVRIICATHQNIEQQIKQGDFREDLYYRISEMVVDIPPLREREGDAIVIATVLLKRFCEQQNKKIMGFSEDAAKAIELYQWPGNIRELENKIKRAVIMADGINIGVDDLQLAQVTDENAIPLNLKEVREIAETNAINRALGYTQNNVTQTAKLLGVTRPTLYTLFSKYSINLSQD